MSNKSFFLIILIAIIMNGYQYSSSNKLLYETRGTWLWASSFDSEDKIKNNIKKILEANINTVLLRTPKVINNHGQGKEKNFASFLKLAYKNGLSVHAWFTNGRRLGRKNHVDFSNQKEQESQVLWISYFLKKYNKYLDGIHLDYIRSKHGAPVNSNTMKGIKDTIYRIRETMKKNYPGKFISAAVLRVSPSFIKPYNRPFEWNQRVPQWFKEWIKDNPNSQYRTIKKGKMVIGTPAFMVYQQDPIYWITSDIVDVVIPMQYTILDRKWIDTLTQFHSFFKYTGIKDKHLFMSLGWMPKRNDRKTRGYDAPGIVRKIKEGRKNNVKGFIIFILSNHGHDDSPLIKALTIPSKANDFNPPFSKRAISLISRFNKIKKK